MGLGVADDIAEDAGCVAGMCQESAMVSSCVAILGSAGQEIGVLWGENIMLQNQMLTIYGNHAPQISHYAPEICHYASKQNNLFRSQKHIFT